MDYLLSPNPTNGQLNIELNNPTTNISIEIVDALGKKINSAKFQGPESNNN